MKKLVLIILALFALATPCLAEEDTDNQIFVPPGTSYTNEAADVSRQLREQSLAKSKKIEVNKVDVSLVHYHYMDADQFGIMMKMPNAVTGCFDVSPLEYEARFIDNNYMEIKIKEYRREAVKTQNVAFDCDQRTKIVSGLVVISAKDLEKRNIKQIHFSNGSSVQDYYNIHILPDRIELEPESMVYFKAANLVGPDKDRLVYHFSNNNMVALHVPMAVKGEDIAQSVRNLAYRSALTPVYEQEGLDTDGENNIFYFMDPHGRTLGTLNEEGYAELGSIQVVRPYDGPEGRTGLPIALKVFATRPGTTL